MPRDGTMTEGEARELYESWFPQQPPVEVPQFDPRGGPSVLSTPEDRLPAVQVPQGLAYLNSPEFQQKLNMVMRAGSLDVLPASDRKQFEDIMEVIPQFGEQLRTALGERGEELPKSKEEEALDRIKGYFLTSAGPLGRGAIAKAGIDILATATKDMIDFFEGAAEQTPHPISPYRNTNADPLTPEEQAAAEEYAGLSAPEKAFHFSRYATAKTSGGLIQFFTQSLDPIVNPEKYQTTTPDAMEDVGTGLAAMIQHSPDQVSHLAEIMFGTPDNPISKLAELGGTILQAPDLLEGRKRSDIKAEAINTFYKNPESLIFATLITKGFYSRATRGLRKPKGPEYEYIAVEKGEWSETLSKADRVTEADGIIEAAREAETRIAPTERPLSLRRLLKKQRRLHEKEQQQLHNEFVRAQSDVTLRNMVLEIMGEQKAGQIAAMTRPELEFRASGGGIGFMPRKAKPKEAPTAEAISEEPQIVADQLGIEYVGKQQRAEGPPLQMFSDPKSGNTPFGVKDVSEVPAELEKVRQEFARKEGVPSVTTVRTEEAVPEKAPVEEKPKAPVSKEEVQAAQKDVADLETEIESKRGILEQVEQQQEAAETPAGKKNADAFRLSLESQIAEAESKLLDAQERLTEIEGRPVVEAEKAPEPTKVMGEPAELVTKQTLEGTDYELYRQGEKGTVRIYDSDAGEVVGITQYPAFETAVGEFNESVRRVGGEEFKVAAVEKLPEGVTEAAPGLYFHDTGKPAADKAANVEATNDYVQSKQESLNRTDLPTEERLAIEADVKKAREMEPRLEKEQAEAEAKLEEDLVVQADRPDAEIAEEIKSRPVEPEPETPPGTTPARSFGDRIQPDLVPIGEINTDVTRFQSRAKPFSEESVRKMQHAYDAGTLNVNNMDPIHLWKDPADGKWYVIEGHSTLEFARRNNFTDLWSLRRTDLNEKAAIEFSRKLANKRKTLEEFQDRVRDFRKELDEGTSEEELKAIYGDKEYGDLKGFAYLDPNGKFIEMISQRAFDDFPHAKKFGRATGELRQRFSELTNTHERQIFDQLYPADKGAGLYNKINTGDLKGLVEDQITEVLWQPNEPIKLKKDYRPKVGSRARPDTKYIMQKVDDLKDRQRMAKTAQEKQALQKDIDKLMEGVQYLVENQADIFGGSGYQLGFFGTPADYAALLNTAYQGAAGISRMIATGIKRLETSPEHLAEMADVRKANIGHHQEVSHAKYLKQKWAHRFKELVPDESRWTLIRDAVNWPGKPEFRNQLNSFERGIVEWLSEQRDVIERFKLDNDLVQKAELPEGAAYLMGHWKDKSGRPYDMDYGRFTRSLPQAKQKTYATYLDGEAAGLEPATNNVGLILGEDWELAARAQAGRQLIRTLNQIDAGIGGFVEGAESQLIKGRSPRILENWNDIEKAGLSAEYKRWSHPFLDRVIRYTDSKGTNWMVRGPVGIHKAVEPWLRNYFDRWEFSSLDKAIGVAKSAKLIGLFHAVQANLTYLMGVGREPLSDIVKYRKLKWSDDWIVDGLARHGLQMKGWADFEFDPVKFFEVHRKGKLGKMLNVASNIWTAPMKLTFHEVVNNLKVAAAYKTFERIWPKWQKKIGPDLNYEQALSKAFRESVRFSDNLLSHPDFRYSMLEANKFSLRAWYSTSARKFWYRVMLAPNWLRSHVMAFTAGVKSLTPDPILRAVRLGEKTPVASAYRRYMGGLAAMYGALEAYNLFATWYMDGEPKFIHQNEKGKRLFHVRALWNSVDGRREYVLVPKTAIEAPKFFVALATGETNLIKGKFNPMFESFVRNFTTDIDELGRPIEEHRSYPERAVDFLTGTYEPIVISNVRSMMEFHKAPIGSVVSALGFPVSKGYPGGDVKKRIDEFLRDERIADEDVRKHFDDLIVSGLAGDHDKITEAIHLAIEAGWSQQRISNRFERYRDPAMNAWNALSQDHKTSILMAMTPEEQKKFIEALFDRGIVE